MFEENMDDYWLEFCQIWTKSQKTRAPSLGKNIKFYCFQLEIDKNMLQNQVVFYKLLRLRIERLCTVVDVYINTTMILNSLDSHITWLVSNYSHYINCIFFNSLFIFKGIKSLQETKIFEALHFCSLKV